MGLLFCVIAIAAMGYLILQTHIEVKAMQKSTHQVQYLRTDDYERMTEELKESLTKDVFDNVQ
jgi:hypothetical protein